MKLLKSAWKRYIGFSRVIGSFQGQVLFTIFYFLLLFPIGIAISLFSDQHNIKTKNKKSNYTPWSHPEEDLVAARKPY